MTRVAHSYAARVLAHPLHREGDVDVWLVSLEWVHGIYGTEEREFLTVICDGEATRAYGQHGDEVSLGRDEPWAEAVWKAVTR